MITLYYAYIIGGVAGYAASMCIVESEGAPKTFGGRIVAHTLSAILWPLFLGWVIGEIHTKLHRK